ncbi:hypothetical protein U1Q18_038410 [Sarracenia purpurea var. burkii]
MATITGFSSPCSVCRAKSLVSPSTFTISLRPVHLQVPRHIINLNPTLAAAVSNKNQLQKRIKIARSVVEETLIPEESEGDSAGQAQEDASTTDQPVSVPVSPSDVLTMFFQAEGTMNETAIPTVTNALQETEGITNLKVKVLEGIASVELTKQTTVQATGVASNLVEIIQGSGFKLQTLNLSFEDEDDII